MNTLKKCFNLTAVLALSACSGINKPTPHQAVFENPQNFIGIATEVCGYLIFEPGDYNFYPSKNAVRQRQNGIGVKVGNLPVTELAKFDNKEVCLKGELFNRGCNKDVICTNSIHEFALEVEEVSKNLPE